MWVTGEFSLSDITELNFPLKYLLYDSLHRFTLPLWTKDLLFGYPALGEGEGGYLYPLNLLLFSLLPPLAGFNYSLIISYLLAGFFTYLFARKIKLRWYCSLLSGIIFMFSGFLVTHLKHPAIVSAASLMPLLFYLVECYFQESKNKALYSNTDFLSKYILSKYIFFAQVVFGLQILAGHQQITAYSIVGVSLYFLFRVLILLLEKPKSQPKSKHKKKSQIRKMKVSWREEFVLGGIKLGSFALILIIRYWHRYGANLAYL